MSTKKGIQKPKYISEELLEIFEDSSCDDIVNELDKEDKKSFKNGMVSRANCMKFIWAYVKGNDLQDGRKILANKDKTLAKLLGNKKVDMTMIAKSLSDHLFDE